MLEGSALLNKEMELISLKIRKNRAKKLYIYYPHKPQGLNYGKVRYFVLPTISVKKNN